jgi:hypothetical protein
VRLAGGHATCIIIIITSIIAPLGIKWKLGNGYPAELTVRCTDAQVTSEKLEVLACPLLTGGGGLHSLARLLLFEAAKQSPHGLEPSPDGRI